MVRLGNRTYRVWKTAKLTPMGTETHPYNMSDRLIVNRCQNDIAIGGRTVVTLQQ